MDVKDLWAQVVERGVLPAKMHFEEIKNRC